MDWRTFQILLQGLEISLLLGVCALAIALVAGLVVAMGRTSRRAWIRLPASLYVDFVRGVPLLVLVLWIYFGPFDTLLAKVGIGFNAFSAAVGALAICYSAFIGETYRAGIESVDPGQTEAARALGLGHGQTLRFVVLPQAIRNVLPALANESISLFKDTSLASVIAVPELLLQGKLEAGRGFRTMEVYSVVALLYLSLTLVLTQVQRALERRYGAGARDPGPGRH